MKNGIEKEYKILLSEKQFKALCSTYEPLHFIKQVNTYYDTAHMDIQKKHGAMRIREKENTCIFTLKMRHGADLMEHECIVPYHTTQAFEIPDIKNILNMYGLQGPFKKIAVCTTYRAVIADEFAELCFDINMYGDVTDYEIEYEYMCEHDGLSAFRKILEPIAVTYHKNCASKIKRALDAAKR